MRIFNKEKSVVLENPDLTKGYLKEDILNRLIPEQDEITEQSHYVTIRTYENGGADVEKVIDVPYREKIPQHVEKEEILIYIPYTENELLEIKKQQLRDWRDQYFRIIDCAVWYDSLNQYEKESVKHFRSSLLDITITLTKPDIPDCVAKRIK